MKMTQTLVQLKQQKIQLMYSVKDEQIEETLLLLKILQHNLQLLHLVASLEREWTCGALLPQEKLIMTNMYIFLLLIYQVLWGEQVSNQLELLTKKELDLLPL